MDTAFNFSHVINELSFGEYYPKLVNPLDGIVSTTDESMFPTTDTPLMVHKLIMSNQTSSSSNISSP